MRVLRVLAALFLVSVSSWPTELRAQKKTAGPNLEQVGTAKIGPGRGIQDSTGQIWRMTNQVLLRWDGQGRRWQETSVRMLPHPVDRGRAGPPWSAWQRSPRLLTGANGTALVVAVRDVYQDVQKDHPDKAKDRREMYKLAQQLAAQRGDRPFWLVGWLLHDGRWTGPQPLVDLLKAERRVLLRDFQGQTPVSESFDLQSDGKKLWYTDGSALHVLDEAGRLASWPLPPEKEWPHLQPTNLLRLPDGAMWCLHGRQATALKLADGRLTSEARPGAPLPGYHAETAFVRAYVARDGQVFLWSQHWRDGTPFFLRDGKWAADETLGKFTCEDSDGGLWFLPGGSEEGSWSYKGYNLLKKDRRYRVPLPEECHRSDVTPAGRDRLLAAGFDRCFLLVRSDKEPAGWKVEATYGLPSFFEYGGLFLDGHGHLVGETGWSARWPDKK